MADARRAFLQFWHSEGEQHFRVEEEVLLPAYTRHRPPDETAVARILTEHVDLRRRAAELEACESPPITHVHELGERLAQHIRYEERVLFPAIEAALSDAELSELVRALEGAERSA
jgi:hemerythrin-like domain-containing protein